MVIQLNGRRKNVACLLSIHLQGRVQNALDIVLEPDVKSGISLESRLGRSASLPDLVDYIISTELV